MKMNARERFLETALFGKPDKIPLRLREPRPATRMRWITEGMPANLSTAEYFGFKECALQSVNITYFPEEGFESKPSKESINIGPIPPFEHKIIREDKRYRIWIDSLGITQLGFVDDWKNEWMRFATRTFIDFPVKSYEDFLNIKRRYNPNDPKRYPKNWNELVKSYRRRDYPLCATIRGPFWWTRDMMGLKRLLLNMRREPKFVKEVMDFCAEFHIGVLHKALDEIELDYIVLSEDVAYKKGPMIGPSMMKEIMSSSYVDLVKFFRDHGVKVIFVDSDGNIEPLIPIWLKLGINGILPCEVAAGMDVVKLGKKYPGLIMMGGIDKRELSKDIEAIKKEVTYKVPPLIKRRGYFPGVDHAEPPDIPLKNFEYFVSLLKDLCGWKN